MTVIEFLIKSMSVLSAVALSTVVWGREMMISSSLVHTPKEDKELVKGIKGDNSAIAKLENLVIGRRKTSVLQGENGVLPFLCDCINYNYSENDEYFCLYNTNQVLYYSISANVCIYFRYNCDIGDDVYTPKECYAAAKKAIYDVFSGIKNVKVTECEITDRNNGICTFCFHTDVTEDRDIIVSVRRDTKNIVLFDARDAEGVICNKNEGAQ